MKKTITYSLMIALLAVSQVALAKEKSAVVFSSNIDVTCTTENYLIEMVTRAPQVGETVVVDDNIVRAKVDVTITDLKTSETVENLVANDNTDTYESGWPAYSTKGFEFRAESFGAPDHLSYKNKSLTKGATCVFKE